MFNLTCPVVWFCLVWLFLWQSCRRAVGAPRSCFKWVHGITHGCDGNCKRFLSNVLMRTHIRCATPTSCSHCTPDAPYYTPCTSRTREWNRLSDGNDIYQAPLSLFCFLACVARQTVFVSRFVTTTSSSLLIQTTVAMPRKGTLTRLG